MKKLLLLTSCVLTTLNSFSQDKGYIAVTLGPSIPIADFASKDPDNESAGLAKTGAVIDISFAYKLGKYFGISALIRGQANPTDTEVLADDLRSQIPPSVTADVKTGSWGTGGALVGGYGSFPISNIFSFESKFMIGFLSASSPKIDIYLDGAFDSGWVKQESATSVAFAHLIGVGFKFNAGKRVCILANLDYLGAEAEFNDVEIVSSTGDIDSVTWKQPFQTINFGVGVGYRL